MVYSYKFDHSRNAPNIRKVKKRPSHKFLFKLVYNPPSPLIYKTKRRHFSC